MSDLRPFKLKVYKDEILQGKWIVTVKLDGVMAIKTSEGWVSRNNKPLYNLPIEHAEGVYEVYLGSFKKSISKVKSFTSAEVAPSNIYSIYPVVDKRLIVVIDTLFPEDVSFFFRKVKIKGYEGLVLQQGTKYYKVKDKLTEDLKVIAYQAGTGKYLNKMGALITKLGKVGTGFTDKEREKFTEEYIVGKTIEVEYMEKTERGYLRHPRFIQLRPDKDT
jgi:hypothetical protein